MIKKIKIRIWDQKVLDDSLSNIRDWTQAIKIVIKIYAWLKISIKGENPEK